VTRRRRIGKELRSNSWQGVLTVLMIISMPHWFPFLHRISQHQRLILFCSHGGLLGGDVSFQA
jgi:hypothetical protein